MIFNLRRNSKGDYNMIISSFLNFSLITIMLSLCSCVHTPENVENTPPPKTEKQIISDLINNSISKSHSDTEALEILYATNRELKDDNQNCSNKSFGVSLTKGIRYGICKVNLPKKSRVGKIENTYDPRADSHTFYRFQGHRALPPDQVKGAILERNPSSLLLFIHGFNVKFEEAVMRAAQISYDLKYQGLPIVFTWPAGAEDGLTSSLINKTYEKNYQSALGSQGDAIAFIRWLSSLKIPLYLGVHSMGHQVLIPALDKLSLEVTEPFIEELILNAPDLSVEDFQKYASALRKVAKRVTVYCSFNDNAIYASETYNSNRRLGACATTEGIDVINVSEVDAPALGLGLGHGYYSSRPIITDLFQIILGIEAEKRLFIRKSEPNSVENYYMRP